MSQIVFDPIVPVVWIVLGGLLLFAATIRVYLQVGARLSAPRKALLLLCRSLALSALLWTLLQPSRQEAVPVAKSSSVLLVGLDSSRSMRQADAAGKATRLQAAKDLVREAGLLTPSDTTAVRFFEFGANAATLSPDNLEGLRADAPTTDFHHSVQTMLDALPGGQTAKGLVLLTDGHDLEATSPAKTAFAARTRRTPVYGVALGAQGNVRDAALHITNYQPYCFVKQRSHLTGSIRVIGCEHENLSVQLLRQSQVVKTVEINAGEQSELPVDFEVTENEPGQYEYEMRVVPLPHELDVRNNSALTFLNVIDQQISVLLVEGAPYWDTTFLSRSLFANDKVALDAVIQYMPGKMRRLRKVAGMGEPKVPATRQDFEHYDVVILGRSVDKVFGHEQIAALGEYVRDHGGTVIFARGQAYDPPDDLDPVTWGNSGEADVSLQAGRNAGALPMLKNLVENTPGGSDAMPRLLGARRVADRKTLAAILGEARGGGEAGQPAMIHRRYGRGQVLSVAVEGLWRWSFNPKTTATNNLFDRYWDQLLVWLVSGADFAPSRQYSFRANTANLLLGESISLRLASRDAGSLPKELPLTILYDDKPVARTSLTPAPDNPATLHASYLPEKTGRYRATVQLPGGGLPTEVKWMVYEDNPEEKEVAVDASYLKALCESSGGSLLSPDELKSTVERLQRPVTDLKPKVTITSLWDKTWVFYLVCSALTLDWYLRRKWGLC